MAALSEVYAEVRVTGIVTANDVARARHCIYASGADVEPHQIESLLRIDEAADHADPSWEVLLAEATLDHFIHEAEPVDVIDKAKADWLREHLSAEGRVKTGREFELLVCILENARSAPDELVALALSQVRMAVIDGEGPLAGMADLDASRATHEEVAVVRRILFAFGGRQGVPISRAIAESLFDINDAVSGADNDPDWTELFVKAIATFVMTANAPPPPPPVMPDDDEDSDTGEGGFADFAVNRLRSVLDQYLTPRPAARRAAADPSGITKTNAQWLAERIGRDGGLDENEKALLRHLRDETPSVHPALKDLINRAA